MNLREIKIKALGLIKEYTKGLTNITDDDDILNNFNSLIAGPYMELATTKSKIMKTKNLAKGENKIPSDLFLISRIVALDENNNITNANFHKIGNNIIVTSDNRHILEYYRYPETITEDTPDDFELEIEPNAQEVLPYAVASNILMDDDTTNYQAFMVEYRRQLESIDTRKSEITVNVIEGEVNI